MGSHREDDGDVFAAAEIKRLAAGRRARAAAESLYVEHRQNAHRAGRDAPEGQPITIEARVHLTAGKYPIRIINSVPPDLDVCIVTPGVLQNPLREMAAENGWSYLSTQHGQVSVAQNRALAHHPSARLIYKIDEDIFISSGFFEAMDAGYAAVVEEGRYRPGFCSPLINVNGFSYVDFLRARGLEEAYVAEFGELRRAADGIKAHHDGQAAVWLWRNSLPVDDVAADFAKRPAGYSPVPHRFSIGAILFERSLWEKMGGFRRGLKAPGLGVDEEHICESCVAFSRTMIVLDNVYAGHFAFGPQESAMREEFETRLSGF